MGVSFSFGFRRAGTLARSELPVRLPVRERPDRVASIGFSWRATAERAQALIAQYFAPAHSQPWVERNRPKPGGWYLIEGRQVNSQKRMNTENSTTSSSDTSSSPRRRPIMGTLLSIGGWAATLVGFILTLYLTDALLPALDEGVWRAGARGGLAAVLAFVAYSGSRLIRSRGRRMRVETALAKMARDPRPPVLYFRSFAEDKFSYFGLASSFEEILAKAFSHAGPLVAIGRPHESLPPIGAARLHVENGKWKEVVTELLKHAAAVVLRPGVTPGVLWEVTEVIKLVPPEHLLIAAPTLPRPKEIRQRDLMYAEFRPIVSHEFPVPLPATLGDADLVMFDSNWNPRTLGKIKDPRRAFRPRVALARDLSTLFERLNMPAPKHRWEVGPNIIGLVLIFAMTQVIFLSGPAWTRYRSADGGFAVDLPGKVEEKGEEREYPGGTLILHTATARWKATEYLAAYAVEPGEVMESQTPDQILDQAKEGVLKAIQGRLLREQRIALDTSAGRDLVIILDSKKMLEKLRIFVIGDRILQLAVYVSEDEEYQDKNSSDVQRFFDSVHLQR